MEANKERGQALLIVVLAMVVALTVGISVVSRSITTLRISTAEEESQRAFSAAEAGIEELLKSTGGPGTTIAGYFSTNQSSYNAEIISSTSPTEYLVPGTVLKDEATQIWLSNYPGYADPKYSGTIQIFWGDPTDSCPDVAALEIIVFSGSINSPTVSRYAVDDTSCGRSNNFTNASVGGDVQTVTFRNSYSVSITSGLIMRIIPLYKSTKIAVRSWFDVQLPSQGKEIESTGKVVSGGQEITRKIKVFQAHPSLPSIFDHAIFSGTSL